MTLVSSIIGRNALTNSEFAFYKHLLLSVLVKKKL